MALYENQQGVVDVERCKRAVICGNWNMDGYIGTRESRGSIAGLFGINNFNEEGDRIIEFAGTNRLTIINTFF